MTRGVSGCTACVWLLGSGRRGADLEGRGELEHETLPRAVEAFRVFPGKGHEGAEGVSRVVLHQEYCIMPPGYLITERLVTQCRTLGAQGSLIRILDLQEIKQDFVVPTDTCDAARFIQTSIF